MIKAELLEVFGDDVMIANVARVSYAKEASNYTEEQNSRLLNFLWKHNHVSPFKHPQVQFRIKCPIYVERQIFKHVIGISTNSISGRYVDFSDTYTTVKDWRKQSKDSKQGSEGEIDAPELASYIEAKTIERCKKSYKRLLDLGVGKEQARTILPLNLNTEFIWTGSLLAFLHMCDLRLKKDAQKETREVVAEMAKELFKLDNFKESYKIANKNWII